MDLLDRVESTRFLGVEFLTWIWFKVELFDGSFELDGGQRVDVWFDTRLVLALWTTPTEKVTLSGVAPSTAAEATSALQQGKVPVKASMRVIVDDNEFAFTFDAQRFSISGVKMPELTAAETEERFIERMFLLEKLDDVLVRLYDEFLSLRLSSSWEDELAPPMREWVQGRINLSPKGYAGMLGRVTHTKAAIKRAKAR